MKAPHRSALLAAGLAAVLSASAVPSVAGAQRNQAPGPDTKKALVTTFRGDPEGGIRIADEIRTRIQGEFNIRTLMPNPKKDIDNTLINSGYRPDSALSPNDIKELAKLIRADEIIDGVVQKTPTGYKIQPRLFLPRDAALVQPLGNYESANIGDIAKQIVDEYDRARKQLPENQNCENGIRANTPAVAIAAARKAIAVYPKATIARLCLASAYEAYKTTADSNGSWKDSVISVAKQTLELDKTSKIALTQLYGAYKAKGDVDNALITLIALMNADPTNTTLRESVIAELVNSGKADIAIPTAKQLVADNPGDPQYAKTYWAVLRLAKRYKESVPAGVAYVTIDTAAADTSYFFRQIQDLVADSAFAKAAEMASIGSAKFPTRTDLLMQKSQNERRAGQLPAAKATLERALALDAKLPNVNYLLGQIALDMGATDDVIKYAKADAAADAANKSRAANLVLVAGKKLYDAAAAKDPKNPDDFRKAIPVLQASDEMSPSVNAKFFLSVSAFQVLALTASELQKSKSCEEYKAASELLTIVNINMGPSGSVSPETAKQILGALPQFQAFIDTSLKNYKCK